MRVLIIEDEPASLKLATLVLSTEGHQVTQTNSAEQAIKAVTQKQPQIILLDLSLPGLDGLALARQLKQKPQTACIPIIAVTAYPLQFSQKDALEAGCNAYIVKPIDTRKLSAQVTAVAQDHPSNS